ncbi:MAG: pyridine nucleotide-disulfide oxidoreductase [Bacteroidetes bacterium SW_11_45_7]|nr:MAG: pyridine nucleotide-disulfide oxidoreductase [Bacteroidetes bacterium SW_11_45_7]
MTRESADVLVIGAGPSGTVAASMIEQAGLNCMIVENQHFPRFMIGESLIPRCMEHFQEAGFMEALQDANFQVKYGANFLRGRELSTFNFDEQYSSSWTWAWQVPRAEFDNILANEIQQRGVRVRYGTGVTDVQFDGSLSTSTLRDDEGNDYKVNASFVIDASGNGRVLPRLLGLDQPSDFPPRKASFVHVEDPYRPEGLEGNQNFFVVLQRDVWVWIIPFADGTTSLGFVGNPEFFDRYEGEGEEKFRNMIDSVSQIKNRFRNVPYLFPPKEITGYSSSVTRLYGEGFALTGNTAEFLDPIFSSGVAFATESGLVAGKLAARQINGEQVDWEKEFASHIREGVDVFRTYVQAWYDGTLQDIAFSNNINPTFKQQISSVLAGQVWDRSNPFVRRHKRALSALNKVQTIEARQ